MDLNPLDAFTIVVGFLSICLCIYERVSSRGINFIVIFSSILFILVSGYLCLSLFLSQPNSLPVINGLTTYEANPQKPGATVFWTANAIDPDNDKLIYMFLLNGKPLTTWIDNNTFTWSTSRADVGNNQFEVRARDSKHAGPDSYDCHYVTYFNIIDDSPPIINRLTPDRPSPQEVGITIIWTADATDPENDPILYRFFLNGRAESGWSEEHTWAWTTKKADIGDNKVEVRIMDNKHANEDSYDASKITDFTILKHNEPPKLNKLTPDKTSPQSGGTAITWVVDATDPENDPIFYKFFLNNMQVTDWITNNKWVWITNSVNMSDNQIGAWIKDGNHVGPDGFDDHSVVSFTINLPIRMYGYITNSISNKPIDGARIELKDNVGNTIKALTDANGYYSVNLLKNIQYSFYVTANEYIISPTSYFSSDGTAKEFGYSYALTPAVPPITSSNYCKISGNVYDASTSKPISNQPVSVTDSMGNWFCTVKTNDGGYFDLVLTRNSWYTISICVDGYKCFDMKTMCNQSCSDPSSQATGCIHSIGLEPKPGVKYL